MKCKLVLTFAIILFSGLKLSAQTPDYALKFDGVDDYVVVSHHSEMVPRHITLECWARSSSSVWNRHGALITKRNSYMFHTVQGFDLLQFFVFANGTAVYAQFQPDETFDISRWHHYAGTYDGHVLSMYADGVKVAETYAEGDISDFDENLYFGRDEFPDRFLEGEIDEIRIWNYARSETNIRRTMHKTLQGNESGLLMYFNFNNREKSGNTFELKDLTNTFTGQVYGTDSSENASNFIPSGAQIYGTNTQNDWFTDTFSKRNIGIGLGFILLIIIGLYLRIRQQKKQKNILENQVYDKTKEIMRMNDILKADNKLKDVLINEIHHRVKNNLQIISSLIYFQTKANIGNTEKEILNNVRRKIDSMALIHEMLYAEADISEISLEKYLVGFVENFRTLAGNEAKNIAFSYQVLDLPFDTKTGIALGMLTSEIVSNAVKHAFMGIENPEITLQLTANDTHIEYLISDNGIGLPTNLPTKKTLGMRLINIFTMQLDADKQIDTTSGTCYTFKIPRPAGFSKPDRSD